MGYLNRFDEAKSFFHKKGFFIPEKTLRIVLSCLDNGKAPIASGGTGSGKTRFYTLLSEWIGGNYFYASLNGAITINDLTQERIIGKEGTFEEKDMILAKWLRKGSEGVSILQLDEINGARPDTLIALHPIMDFKGELRLPYSDEVLMRNENCILVMSCNEGDEYLGRYEFDLAFKQRTIKIYFEYPMPKEIIELLRKSTGISKEDASMIVNVWEKYMKERTIDQPPIGIRVLEDWALMSKGLGLSLAGIATFASTASKNNKDMIKLVESDLWIKIGLLEAEKAEKRQRRKRCDYA